jgi:hypothetical protein
VNLLQLLHVLAIEGDELLVLVNAGWSDRLCEDGGVAGDFDEVSWVLEKAYVWSNLRW